MNDSSLPTLRHVGNRCGSTRGPVLSIVTVTFSDPDGFRNTIESIPNEWANTIELVVVEGRSAQASYAARLVAELRPDMLASVIYGYDSGPYDAMNRGVLASSGMWLWFVNGGDRVAPHLDIARLVSVLEDAPSHWVVGTAELVRNGKRIVKGFEGVAALLAGAYTPCHQAVFTRREAFLGLGLFNPKLTISADYDFMCRLALQGPATSIGDRVAVYQGGGLSDRYFIRREFQAATVRVRLSRKKVRVGAIEYARAFRRSWLGISRRNLAYRSDV